MILYNSFKKWEFQKVNHRWGSSTFQPAALQVNKRKKLQYYVKFINRNCNVLNLIYEYQMKSCYPQFVSRYCNTVHVPIKIFTVHQGCILTHKYVCTVNPAQKPVHVLV